MVAKKSILVTLGLGLLAGLVAIPLVRTPEKVLLSGEFHSVAHKGAGQARIVSTAGGQNLLKIVNLKTYPGSMLQVCLVAAPDAEDNDTVLASGHVCLGPWLGAKTGLGVYPVPAALDLNRYRAVSIWQPEYRVNFTTAPLAP
ncbi:MAG: DM13 domain-containing protein [Bryobacteraceae bacterium]|nr:DM13 domain-containing protein [Bryobacteraceae bacterium]